MGGKSYFCDYCRCFLKNDINVRKMHNSGLVHKIAKVTYMRRFEEPQKLLAEEESKQPCTRYLKGYCKFDLFCQFSHFNEKQIRQLRRIVNKLEYLKQKQQKEIKKNEPSQCQQILPWFCSASAKAKRKTLKLKQRLPQSLKPINFNKLNDKCLNTEWG